MPVKGKRVVPQLRPMTVVAQDPSVTQEGEVVMGTVLVPYEDLEPGPKGHRIHVVDYDASTDRWRKPIDVSPDVDPYEGKAPSRFLDDPHFHAWNCYAIAMSTLRRFEFALGRRVKWKIDGHQLKVVPHAFADANAFYSRQDESLLFGYFEGSNGTVQTCLAHDVIAHETTHALLDGLRERYTDASSHDQAAFHEGFADVVALLSVFAMPGVAGRLLDSAAPKRPQAAELVDRSKLSPKSLRSAMLVLGREIGRELEPARGAPLRDSTAISPSPAPYRILPEFREPHRRGEILVAAMLNAFLEVWLARIRTLGTVRDDLVDRARVVEDGAAVADALLTMSIRALDYCPAVDVQFGDYVAALLTADRELRPDDSLFELRKHVLEMAQRYGLAKPALASSDWTWKPVDEELTYSGVHIDSLRREPDEVFRFLWDNRGPLALDSRAYARVLSVRPCVRVDPEDGFTLHESVAEYYQVQKLRADELRKVNVRAPDGMPRDTEVSLYSGGALVFDEFGHLKYHVPKPFGGDAMTERLQHRWDSGEWSAERRTVRRFAQLHRMKSSRVNLREREEW
jgi:hypothetical protein